MKISDLKGNPFDLYPDGDALTSGEVLVVPEAWATDWAEEFPDRDAVSAIAKSALDDNDAIITAVPVYDRKGYTSSDNFGEQHRNSAYNNGDTYHMAVFIEIKKGSTDFETLKAIDDRMVKESVEVKVAKNKAKVEELQAENDRMLGNTSEG